MSCKTNFECRKRSCGKVNVLFYGIAYQMFSRCFAFGYKNVPRITNNQLFVFYTDSLICKQSILLVALYRHLFAYKSIFICLMRKRFWTIDMNELKLKNHQLAKENAMLKSKLNQMGLFSKRLVEITAKMDSLLEQRAKEIRKLKEDSNSGVTVEEVKDVLTFIEESMSTLCSTNSFPVNDSVSVNAKIDLTDLGNHGNDGLFPVKNQNPRKRNHTESNSIVEGVPWICSPSSNDNNANSLVADNELKDFTVDLDGFVAELTQIKEEPVIDTSLDFYDLPSSGPYPRKTCEITMPPHKSRTRTAYKCGLCQKFICKRDQLMICPCCYRDKIQCTATSL